MAEEHIDRVHDEPIVLDVGNDVGALVLYTGEELREKEIEISRKGAAEKKIHTAIHERTVNGRTIFAGVYPSLPAGDYDIWGDDGSPVSEVTIVGGHVAEVDWRRASKE